jgi:HAD superfamily hydrolase (TIGR01549 family)
VPAPSIGRAPPDLSVCALRPRLRDQESVPAGPNSAVRSARCWCADWPGRRLVWPFVVAITPRVSSPLVSVTITCRAAQPSSGPLRRRQIAPVTSTAKPRLSERETNVIRSVVFDVGETLLDDTREFNAWADWLGVPRHTFSALIGIVVAQGRNNAEAFQYLRPGFDLATERQLREEAGQGEQIEETDLYPDARSTLAELRARGIWTGIAGNQTARGAELLRALDLPIDGIATSGEWGVAKPDLRFFRKVIDFAPGNVDEIVYVGDHRDYDIKPAQAAGLQPVLIRRGPWGYLWADDPAVRDRASWVIDSLAELPDLVRPPAAD